MNKKLVSAVLTLVMVFAFASMSFAANLDFTLVNKTGFDIAVVNVSPASSDDWQEDVLGSQILGNNQQVSISFPANANETIWDIQCYDAEGGNAIWSGLDLSTISTVTLVMEGGSATAYLD